MKKTIFNLLVIGLLCLYLIGCNEVMQNENVSNQQEENVKDNEEQVINISTVFEERYLDVAKKSFEKNNPNITVNIKEYADSDNDDNNQVREKYKFNINTEIMSGKGPDIINIEELPYKKYVDMGAFTDIKELINNDKTFDESQYFINVIKAMEYNNGIYAIPLNCSIDMIGIEGNVLKNPSFNDNWNWKEFFARGKESLKNIEVSNGIVLSQRKSSVFEKMFADKYEEFVDEKNKEVNINSDKFINMLEYCNKLDEEGYVISENNISKEAMQASLAFFYPAMRVDYLAGEMFSDYITGFYKVPSDNDKVTFTSTLMYAINSNTKNKEGAWEFLKYLISDEMQSTPELFEIPINKKAFEHKLEYEKEQFMDRDAVKAGDKDRATRVFNKCSDIMSNTINSLNNCNRAKISPEISDMVYENIMLYFNNENSVQEVANMIQNKVMTYLQEQ